MRRIKLLAVSILLPLILCSCSQTKETGAVDSAEKPSETPAETTAPADPAEETKNVLTQYSKWVIGEAEGTMKFNDDLTGSFISQLGDLPMTWEIKDDMTIHTSFEYSGTKYGASYNLVETASGYELQNVKDSSKAFKAVK